MGMILFMGGAYIFIILVFCIMGLIAGLEEGEKEKQLYETDREAWEQLQKEKEQRQIEFQKRAEERANNIKCPHCGCTHYTIMHRGWKITTGFLGSSKPIRVCDNCMKKF